MVCVRTQRAQAATNNHRLPLAEIEHGLRDVPTRSGMNPEEKLLLLLLLLLLFRQLLLLLLLEVFWIFSPFPVLACRSSLLL